jgi:hypothetical protein
MDAPRVDYNTHHDALLNLNDLARSYERSRCSQIYQIMKSNALVLVMYSKDIAVEQLTTSVVRDHSRDECNGLNSASKQRKV